MEDFLIFAAMSAQLIALFAVLYWVERMQRREAMYHWASGSGLNLLTTRPPLVTQSRAIPVSSGKSPQVVRVHVETDDGNRRSGWVQLDSVRPGLTSPDAEVRWDSE